MSMTFCKTPSAARHPVLLVMHCEDYFNVHNVIINVLRVHFSVYDEAVYSFSLGFMQKSCFRQWEMLNIFINDI